MNIIFFKVRYNYYKYFRHYTIIVIKRAKFVISMGSITGSKIILLLALSREGHAKIALRTMGVEQHR